MIARAHTLSTQMVLGICLAVDAIDLVVGSVLGLGAVADVLQTVVAVWLFGFVGLVSLWELAVPIDVLDGFAPTLTILALTQLPRRRRANRPRSIS